jgi:hypothetical protein
MTEHLHIVPVDWQTVRGFIADFHRHHRAPQGHKFSLGVATGDRVLRGVAVVGRPVARHYQAGGQTLEVTRTATDGTPNANSALYGAAWRAVRALGYTRLVTYTQAGESGTSLRAAGWRIVAERPAHPGWDRPSRRRALTGTENIARTLWEAS